MVRNNKGFLINIGTAVFSTAWLILFTVVSVFISTRLNWVTNKYNPKNGYLHIFYANTFSTNIYKLRPNIFRQILVRSLLCVLCHYCWKKEMCLAWSFVSSIAIWSKAFNRPRFLHICRIFVCFRSHYTISTYPA